MSDVPEERTSSEGDVVITDPLGAADRGSSEDAPAGEVREGIELRIVGVVAGKTLRDAVRDRWFWLYCLGFALLAAGIALIALPDTGLTGDGGFGRTAASLVVLVQLVVTLMAIMLGARSLAGERESGSLRFLLSQPVSRSEVLLGTYVGLGGALLAAVSAGFGVAGFLSVVRSSGLDAFTLLSLAGLSWMLALVMLGIGMVVSVVTRRGSTALGAALLTWLVFVFVGDLGLMGTAASTDLPVSTLFFTAVANPVEAFRLTTVLVLEGSLDVLGPAGSYAYDRFGDGLWRLTFGILLFWVLAPLLLAWGLFRRRVDL
jgi:ABC-type transport system involved in multi-copper enzyme maturation permease subunit